jgi:hypothetical protein
MIGEGVGRAYWGGVDVGLEKVRVVTAERSPSAPAAVLKRGGVDRRSN